jgi:hypothetical protein
LGPIAILQLVHRSIVQERRRYQTKNRYFSIPRLSASLFPNLRRPIFILGSPRSGTTFLGECIGKLPEVSYHLEPVATKTAARYVNDGQWGYEQANRFYRTAYAWLMRLHLDADLRFAEKTPRNCFLLNFLAQAFPDAQFIHIIRDGRDAALSHSKQPWMQSASADSGHTESGGYLQGPYPRFWVEPERRQEFELTTDIHRCIWAWRRHTECVLAADSGIPVSQYCEIRYEALVRQPSETADLLLSFLGIDIPTSRQVFRDAVCKADPGSVGRWRSELTTSQLQQVEAEAGELLTRLGYTHS